MEEKKELNIFQRMSAITEEIGRIAKNLTVGSGNNKYKAVGEVDVLNAVKPAEIKFGVYSYPASREVIETEVLTSENEYGKRNSLFLRIKTIYRFVNIDKPEEAIEITTYGDGLDSQDKSTGKAMTYADKYALLKAYKIETGDDPDARASEPTTNVASGKKATAKQVELLAKAYTGDNLTKLLQANKIEKLEDISMAKASELITKVYSNKEQKEVTK